MAKTNNKKKLVAGAVLLWICGLALEAGGIYVFLKNSTTWHAIQPQTEKRDPHLSFLIEVHNKIKKNYWQNISDAELAELFKQASEQLVGAQRVFFKE